MASAHEPHQDRSSRSTDSLNGPGLNRRILSLAIPSLGALIAQPVFVLIDSAMVGHLGAVSLAGLSLASSILTTTVGLFVFLAYATTATTARLFGAGDRRGGLRAGIDGMWLALLIGVAAAALLWLLAPPLVSAFGASGEVAGAAVDYLRFSAPGIPGMLLVYASTGTLRGLLDTRTPFIVATLGAVVNVGLNAIFLYGLRMGVGGSGLGTAITETLMAVALALPVIRAARADAVALRPRRAGLGASLGSGTPLFIRTLTLRAAILLTVWAATALGPAALAAHQILNSLWSFSAMALDSLAIAAQALIGTSLGMADAARGASPESVASPEVGSVQDVRQAGTSDSEAGFRSKTAKADRPGEAADLPKHAPQAAAVPEPSFTVDQVLRRSLAWGVGTGVVVGLILAVASPWIPLAFTSDSEVVAAASAAILVLASAMPLAGAVFLFDGVLMGAGDGVYLAKAGIITLLPYTPLAILIQQGTFGSGQAGLVALWIAFAWVFMLARGLTTGLRARTDAWRH